MRQREEEKLRGMIAAAYEKLGVAEAELDAWVLRAMDYLARDREHYIEVTGEDDATYFAALESGRICHLLPLAVETIEDPETDHVRIHTAIFSLMVCEDRAEYVYGYFLRRAYRDAQMDQISYPVYRYAQLQDIRQRLCVLPPQDIRPVATAAERELFAMLFAAFAHFGKEKHIHWIPQKTEMAMLAAHYGRPEEITVDGKKIVGKRIPLAHSFAEKAQLREDHRYNRRLELNLLIGQGTPRFLLRTVHSFSYFRKVSGGEDPMDFFYETTEEKQEITDTFVELADVPQEMCSFYY